MTEDAAATFADLALRLRQAGHDAQDVAHFVNRLVFCMFAEDVRLLPEHMFEKMVFASHPESFEENCRALFAAMARQGGRVGFTPIPWFNGGLFDDDTALPVDADDIAMLRKAAKMDWSRALAFEGAQVQIAPAVSSFSDIDAHQVNTQWRKELGVYTLFDFSAKFDPVPSMLTQNHHNYHNKWFIFN